MSSLIPFRDGPSPTQVRLFDAGQAMTKLAGDAEPSYGMSGMLYCTQGERGSWGKLTVPAALVRGAFKALDEDGITLPDTDGRFEPHITVFRPEEIDSIGGIDKITERGKHFHYRIGGLVSFVPRGWPGMQCCWALRVWSPELRALRKSYNLSELPGDGSMDFHMTVAVKKRGGKAT